MCIDGIYIRYTTSELNTILKMVIKSNRGSIFGIFPLSLDTIILVHKNNHKV